MDEAYNLDKEANKLKKPALRRFLLLPKIDQTLRKLTIYEEFLEKQGCSYLYNWLI